MGCRAAVGRTRSATLTPLGEMDERFKSHAWKACEGVKALRGFESRSLRQIQGLRGSST
jgi:hypothetical protein